MIRADGQVFASSQVVYDIIGNPMLNQLYELALINYGLLT